MIKKLVIAYIGNGKSTNRYHLPFALKLPEKIEVKTIYSRKDNSPWDKIAGIKYTNDINDIYNDPEIDCVVATVPAVAHMEIAKDVLLHGKNLVMEKPFTNTEAEAKELYDLAKEKNLLLQCYTNRRFDSDWLTVQKVIESGKLGELIELDNNFDYYRPEVPTNGTFSVYNSYLYGHGCHTLDQIISYFGKADSERYDVRQTLGKGHPDDYFDVNLYYGNLKVSVSSSYFRLTSRPSFAVYGRKGSFIKQTTDQQETDLKKFYMPNNADFGLDRPEEYGTLTYLDDAGQYHEEKVVSEVGDYSIYYSNLYETLINGKPKASKDEQTIEVMRLLETGLKDIVANEQGNK